MTKPVLWLTCGFGFSATSPLAYTLEENNYVNSGYYKELDFLVNIEKLSRIEGPLPGEKGCDKFYFKRKRVHNYLHDQLRYTHKTKHQVNSKYKVPDAHKIAYEPYTISQFIDYHLALWDIVKVDGYKGVGNFSNQNRRLSHGFLSENSELLMKHFDVKCGLIVRDPIRRAWAFGNTKKLQVFHPSHNWDYLYNYDKFRKYLPTHIIVMEELWEGDGTEKARLEEFIDHPIDKLYKNQFAPDRGHLLEYDEDLKDQSAKLPELTPELYERMRHTMFAKTYRDWEKRFGKLPLHWGKPLEYK